MTTTAAAAALSLAALAAAPAVAQDACVDDVKRFCTDIAPGSGKIVECLRANEHRLTGACRDRLEANARRTRVLVEQFGRACRSDVEALCAGVEPGSGRVVACLDQHQLELSPSCAAEMARLADARGLIATFKEVCGGDIRRLCSGSAGTAGALVECVQANKANLSASCSAADLDRAAQAGAILGSYDEMTRRDRIREVLQILQGVDSVAFSRSQILLQFDSYQELNRKANAWRFLFSPQFVFGPRREFALQIKVPTLALYPYAEGAPAQFALGDVTTSLSWNVFTHGQMSHYLALGVQWDTTARPAVGAGWALTPAYAIALGLARWVSITTQVAWTRSVGSTAPAPETDLLLLEPFIVFNLPGRSFLALDTKLGWNLDAGTFLPIVKGVAGTFVDRRKSLSVSVWYQAALRSAAIDETFKYGVGLGLAYYYE